MRRFVAVALMLGLVAGSLAAPAAAKKKKKKKKPPVPIEQTFYLHWDDDGADGCGGLVHMSTEDKDDPGSGCWYVAQGAQEVLAATGAPLIREWPASDGTPLRLDATKPVSGEITLRGLAGVGSLEVALIGTIGDSTKELGAASVDYVMPPSAAAGPTIVEFEFELSDEVNKKIAKSLTFTTSIRGASALPYIDLNNPPSFVTVPGFNR